ncbi:unnamed protein product [[Candida] boidinii]|nr:unnamed protein product [[Candida] boidinii]
MGGGMDASDIFSQFFGGGGSGFGGGFGQRPSGPQRGRDIKHVISCSLEELYKGRTAKLALNKTILCPDCKGKGGKEGAVKQCTDCHGSGMKFVTRQMGPMIQRFQTTCDKCNGEGDIIDAKDRCKTCKVVKVINILISFQVMLSSSLMKNHMLLSKEKVMTYFIMLKLIY